MVVHKLGRKAIKVDSRNLRLARYLTTELPTAPAQADYSKGITDWGEMLNDSLGCCTIAAVGHAVQVWTACTTGAMASVPDSVIQRYYSQWDGYDPTDPTTDQGGIALDVLNNWRTQGFAGHKLLAHVVVSSQNIEMVKQAINLFGGVYIGVSLPLSAQGQDVWNVGSGPSAAVGSWGGHCVYVVGYDATGVTCITWGKLQRMTWNFWSRYVDEAHPLLSPDFIAANNYAPNGLDLQQLQADLACIT